MKFFYDPGGWPVTAELNIFFIFNHLFHAWWRRILGSQPSPWAGTWIDSQFLSDESLGSTHRNSWSYWRSRWNAAPAETVQGTLSNWPFHGLLSLTYSRCISLILISQNISISTLARWGNCELPAFQHLTKVFLGMSRKSKLRTLYLFIILIPWGTLYLFITFNPLNFIILELNNQISTHLNDIFSSLTIFFKIKI